MLPKVFVPRRKGSWWSLVEDVKEACRSENEAVSLKIEAAKAVIVFPRLSQKNDSWPILVDLEMAFD